MNEHESRDEQFDETRSGERHAADPCIDERASALLDSAALDPAAENYLAPIEALDALDPPSARRVADMQFLHVLLNELHHGTAEINSARVQRAMAAIHEEPAVLGGAAVGAHASAAPVSSTAETVANAAEKKAALDQPRRWSRAVTDRRSWLLSATALAATLACVALWLVAAGPYSQVYAAVQRVAADARILKDRQYRVTQMLNFDHNQQGSTQSELYVRGGEKFALEYHGPLGTVWMGSNGREGWLIPTLGPPIVTDNPRYPARWAREEGLALPDLKLTGLLDLMAERFQLRFLSPEALPDQPSVVCQRIHGWCDRNDGGAKRIDLWAHPVTGVAQRLVLQWDRAPEEQGLTAIQLDLQAETPQQDKFYEVAGHPRPRPVLGRIPILPYKP